MHKQKNIKLIILTLTIILICTSFIMAEDFDRNPRFNINAVTDDGLIGQAGILYPLRDTKNSILYTDLRSRLDSDQEISEWNFGLGYRNKFKENLLGGLYIFKDRRKEFDHYWDMWTLGGEILSNNFDLRANAYLADNERIDNPLGDSVIEAGGRLLYQKSFYSSLDGFDFELGKRWTETDNLFNKVGVYARFYNFFAEDVEDVRGRELRINKEFGSKEKTNYQLGLMWEDSNQSQSSVEATFAVSIPFGSKKKQIQEDEKHDYDRLEARMTEAPTRDLNIVVSESDPEKSLKNGESVTARDLATGKELGNVYYVTKDGKGKGSKDSPTNIDSVVEMASENDIIILLGDNGEIINNSLSLKKGQKLIGPGGYILVSADQTGSRTSKFMPEGMRASLSGNPAADRSQGLIILNDDTTVSGLNLTVTSEGLGSVIYGQDIKGNITITDNRIESKANSNKITPLVTRSSSYNNYGIEIDSELNQAEEINLLLKENDFRVNAGAVTVFVSGIEKDLVEAVKTSREPKIAYGSFKADISGNNINFANDFGFGFGLSELNNSNVYIYNNNINKVYGREAAGIILVQRNDSEAISKFKIYNNIIKDIHAAERAVVGIMVNNQFNEKADISTIITDNNLSNIDSGFNESAYFIKNGAIAVNNFLASDSNAFTVISNNQIENIRGSSVSLDRKIQGSINRYGYQNNAISIINYGINGGKVTNKVNKNIIKDIDLGSQNNGIYIKNGETVYYDFLRANSMMVPYSGLKTAINEIDGNQIKDISSNYDYNTGIKVENNVTKETETIIKNNNINQIRGEIGRLSPPELTAGITVFNYGNAAESAKVILAKNNIENISTDYNAATGINIRNSNFEDVDLEINKNSINNITSQKLFRYRTVLRIRRNQTSGIQITDDRIAFSNILVNENEVNNIRSYSNSGIGLNYNNYNSLDNKIVFNIKDNSFDSIYTGISLAINKDLELKNQLEKNNYFNEIVEKVIFDFIYYD